MADSISSAISDVATSSKKAAMPWAEVNGDGLIEQSERLFTTRPRYAPKVSTPEEIWSKGHASRGVHAFIKLMTSKDQADKYSTQAGVRESSELTGPESLVAQMVSSDTGSGYDHFLLTHVSCQLQEKLQVTEVFGDGEVAYYFGRQPIMFSISGVLIDSPDNNWFVEWLKMYNGVLRGSQLAQNYELLKLVLPTMVLTGTISGTTWEHDSSNDVATPFTFQFMVKRIDPIPAVTQEPLDSDLTNLINFSSAAHSLSQEALNKLKFDSASLQSVISNPFSSTSDIGKALSSAGSALGGIIGSLNSMNAGLADWVNNNAFSTGLNNVASLFRTISANLNGIRAQLVSPIYGILTSLVKLVKNTMGAVNSIFNSIFSPIRNVLRDISNITNQAVGLVNLVTNSVKSLGRNLTNQIGGTKNDFNNIMKSVGKGFGSIGTAPTTLLQSVQSLVSGGVTTTSATYLKSNPKASLSSAVLSKGASMTNYKIAILHSAAPYTPVGAAHL